VWELVLLLVPGIDFFSLEVYFLKELSSPMFFFLFFISVAFVIYFTVTFYLSIA
jgi:hypothetical protein